MKALNFLTAIFATLFAVTLSYGQIAVTPTNDATTLANNLIGSESGITIVNATYTGAAAASGTFTNGDFGVDEGILLTSGNAVNAIGPNIAGGTTTENGADGDSDLDDIISPLGTNDASVLEITFIPDGNVLEFTYVFASEEYNEYVCSSFNDVFAFIVNGGAYTNQNIAILPGTDPPVPVSINNVNNGTVGSSGSESNCTLDQLANSAFFVDNDEGLNIEYDGYTVALNATLLVEPGVEYTIKLAIADAGDSALDSGVFLEGQSFVSTICDAGTIAYEQYEGNSLTFCPDDVPSSLSVMNDGNGLNDTYVYIVTNPALDILEILESNVVEPASWDPASYLIWGLSYAGNLSGLEVGQNADALTSDGCLEFSNSLEIIILEACGPQFICEDLAANPGDPCDDENPDTENDLVGTNCICAGTPIEEEPVFGCTDENANNFNPEATEDDGSCTYDPDPIPGCTDEEAINYNPEATEDDGSCEYPPSTGCYGAEIIEYVEGTKLNGTALDPDRVDPTEALGEPDRVNAVGGFVALGYGGSVSIAFDGAVLDQDGDDILVWETSYSSDDCLSDGIEAAQIELSQDGITWIPAGTLCRDGAVDIASAGLEWVTGIKIINDPSSNTFDGYDLDGVEAINGCGPIPEEGCFGSEVLSYLPGPLDNGLPITDPLRLDPTKALGAPQLDDTYNFVSLGYGGELIIGFDGAVLNAPGADILVAETTFNNQTFATYPESADVLVSQNGTNFFHVGSLTTNQVGLFDIDDAGQGFDYIIAVKVVDTTPEGSVSEDGFDVDAVEALNGCGPIPEIVNGECAATEVVEYVEGTRSNGAALPVSRTDASQATGEPEGTDAMVFVTLGYGGSVVLAFDGAVPNEDGPDLEVVETSFGNPGCAAYPEYADIHVSQNGVDYFFAKTVCKSDNLVDINDAGQGWDYVNFVKVVNNDLLTTSPDGYDLDGVRALHNCLDDDGDDNGENAPTLAANAPNELTSQPNPTTGQSTVFFKTVTTAYTTIEVFDMSGRSIATLFNQVANEGQQYQLDFDGNYLANGVYIYRLTTENDVVIEKFMIAR